MGSLKHFVSVDWGTTNFRASYINGESLEVMAHCTSGRGIANVYADFLQSGNSNQLDYFIQELVAQLNRMKLDVGDAKVVISGMASSNIGLISLPYAKLPIGRHGEGVICHRVSNQEEICLFLISGVQGDHTVMRGEETQAIGLVE